MAKIEWWADDDSDIGEWFVKVFFQNQIDLLHSEIIGIVCEDRGETGDHELTFYLRPMDADKEGLVAVSFIYNSMRITAYEE